MRRVRHGIAAAFVLALGASAWAADGDCRVIVACKGDADAAALEKLGVDVESAHGSIAAGTVPPGKIAALRADPSVAYVEEDGIAEAIGKAQAEAVSSQSQTLPWGVSKVWGGTQPTLTGSGVKVAVIDTGIDFTHTDLDANVDLANSTTFVSRTSSAKDDNGHGTHVAGTIAAEDNGSGVVGVAPSATLFAVKVLDRRGSGLWSWVASGIDWARTHGANVANMSLGGGASTTIENACSTAWNNGNGVLLIAAAGNSGDGKTTTSEWSYPAAYSTVVSVGATDSSDNVASFSNTNNDVEVSAPGVSIVSTYKGGAYATMSGTSMATPHAVGNAALLWQEAAGSASASSVKTMLDTRVRSKLPTVAYGFGIVYFPAP